MIVSELAPDLPWDAPPLCFLSLEQQVLFKQTAEMRRYRLSEIPWSTDAAGSQMLVVEGRVRLVPEEGESMLLKPGDWLGDCLELPGLWKARAADKHLTVAFWSADQWRAIASRELEQFWAVQRQRYLPKNDDPKLKLVIRKRREQARYFVEALGDLGLDMLLLPGGTFLMGSPEDEPERNRNEGPQQVVTISQFFMGRYPVTQAQWQFVAELPQANRALQPNPSHFEEDNRPVEQVSWYEAVEFCERLSAHTGRTYRLPSEAEWEHACRAGTQTLFYFGKTLTTELANYAGNSTYNDGPKGEHRKATTPVDQFGIANAFGLCDMHGNVWEWCLDHWHDNYDGAPTDGSAWLTDDEGSSRILRGGSWHSNPRHCRSACRISSTPDTRNYNLGFRVVCVAP